MPATASTDTPDPEAIRTELQDLEARRDRLQEKREAVQSDLSDARTALQEADSEEAQEDALDEAERLQLQADTLTEAISDVETDLEVLRDRLAEVKAIQEEEERLEALAELGREAVESRQEYEAVRAEIVEVLRDKAPELAQRFSAWIDAAEDFRSALRREERGVYSTTTRTDEEERRAEQLISELKERGVTPFLRAIAPFRGSGQARKWMGWSYNEDGPEGPLKNAVEAIRSFGNRSTQSSE